jgi:hypothetical protein
MNNFENSKKEISIEQEVDQKLQKAQEDALSSDIVENELSRFLQIQKQYHSEEITNAVRYSLSQPIIQHLLNNAARFDTIGEYSLAFRKLHESKWLSRSQADEILAHENDHAMPVLQHPSGDVEYLIIFTKNKNGVTDSFFPIAYTKFKAGTDEEGRDIAFSSISAPEILSSSDLSVIKDII